MEWNGMSGMVCPDTGLSRFFLEWWYDFQNYFATKKKKKQKQKQKQLKKAKCAGTVENFAEWLPFYWTIYASLQEKKRKKKKIST